MKKAMQSKRVLLTGIVVLLSGVLSAQRAEINYYRPYDKSGINIFETTKLDTVPFTGVDVRISGGFKQSWQSLSATNNADVVLKDNTLTSTAGDSVDINALYPLRPGFNLASANLIIDAQLADGIYVKLENYMSARHHNEFWVKGGFIQVDKLPMFGNPEWFSKNFTIKVGDMEVNYGDAHFYRTDNANAIYNPFVEQNIMDAFATEVAGELYFKPESGFIAMLGMSSGLLNADLTPFKDPTSGDTLNRKPSIYGKLGYDKQLNTDLRVRLTGSIYMNGGTSRNTLYAGDRAGSNYYLAGETQYYVSAGVLTASSATNKAFSGRLDPGFSSKVTAIMINPFIKWKGLEIFGTYEMASGDISLSSSGVSDTTKRSFSQMAVSGLYRFLPNEQCYVGVRYNTVSGRLFGYSDTDGDITVNRMQIAAGWFPTSNILLKLEYVTEDYVNFKTSDYRSELNFSGVVVEAAIGF
ncbi:MAG: hypothetical protein R2794_03315 [Chitinophagales bacterium]